MLAPADQALEHRSGHRRDNGNIQGDVAGNGAQAFGRHAALALGVWDTTASVREAIAPPIASAEQVEATSGVKVMRGNGGPPKALIIDVARASLLNPKSPPSGLEDLFRAPLPGLPPRAPRSPRQKAQIDADEQPLEAPARTLGRNERAFD